MKQIAKTRKLFSITFFVLFYSIKINTTENNLPSLDSKALELYEQLKDTDQDTKDKAFRNAAETLYWQASSTTRNATYATLLAGAHPNILKHSPFEDQEYTDPYVLLDAIRANDFSLVTLFLDCLKNHNDTIFTVIRNWEYIYEPWTCCNTREMVNLLVKYKIPLYDPKKNICALTKAATHNLNVPYIRYLLQLCPQAVFYNNHEALQLVSYAFKSSIKNGSKEELLQLLMNYGASPYIKSSSTKRTLLDRLEDPEDLNKPLLAHWMKIAYAQRITLSTVKSIPKTADNSTQQAESIYHPSDFFSLFDNATQ